jgi:hypothetical protein
VDERAHLGCAAPAPDGGLVAAGARPAPGGSAWEIVRLSARGAVEWTRTIAPRPHPLSPARATAVAVAPDGHVLVAGSVTGPSVPPGEDWMLAKLDPRGRTVWERTWNSADDRLRVSADVPASLAVGRDGAAYLLGTARIGDGPPSAWLRAYGPDGGLRWSRTAPGNRAVGVTRQGLILAVGTSPAR